MLQRPNLFFIGQQKAGTSAVYSLLCNSEDIYTPVSKKEFHYLICGALSGFEPDKLEMKGVVRDESTYLSYFSKSAGCKYVADFSTSYLYYYDEFLSSIGEAGLDQVKVVVIKRECISRTISAYKHLFKYGKEYAATCLGRSVSGDTEDLLWDEDVVGYTKKTNEAIDKIRGSVGDENLLVVDYQELVSSPSDFFDRLSKFLSVDLVCDNLSRKNESIYLKSKFLSSVFFGQSKVRQMIKRHTPYFVLNIFWRIKSIALSKFSSDVNLNKKEIELIEEALS